MRYPARMAVLPSPDLDIDLRMVTVRPTRGARGHRLRDRLMEELHHLRFHGIVGKGLHHVALHGGIWLAPVGWPPGASDWRCATAGSAGRRTGSSGGCT